ncbi:MAG: hypothetical protein KAS72_12495 [Phycisphaerales bacterium]|nr:hypothetical protein [Phycisphaerales bacterium]
MDEGGAALKAEVGGFRLGLSRLIRYSYGGLLLAFLSALLEPAKTKGTIDALSAPVALAVAVGLGAAIYVLHRHVVIPLHHLLLCGLFQLGFRDASPTAFLNNLGVKPGRRMLAYTLVRWSDFFHDKQARDIAHAENGLLILTAEGLFIASWYAWYAEIPDKWLPYFVLGLVFFIASYGPAIRNHSWECFVMKRRQEELVKRLQEMGLVANRTPEAEAGKRG